MLSLRKGSPRATEESCTGGSRLSDAPRHRREYSPDESYYERTF